MPIISADVTEEIKDYVDSLIDSQVVYTRSDAIRLIVGQHRDMYEKVEI